MRLKFLLNLSFNLFLILLLSCSPNGTPPTDAEAEKLIRATYTVNNQSDGAEYCTVRELTILEKKMLSKSSCRVKYHIDCYYSGPAMPPGYERDGPPPINTDSTAVLKKQDGGWMVEAPGEN